MDAERPPRTAYRFDRFTLDLGRGALLAPDGAELPLRPKSFTLLQLFVENARAPARPRLDHAGGLARPVRHR